MYTKDPNNEGKVIDTSFQPPSLDPEKLSEELAKIKQIREEVIEKHNSDIAAVDREINTRQAQLNNIYTQVPEVKPKLDIIVPELIN